MLLLLDITAATVLRFYAERIAPTIYLPEEMW